MGAAFHITELSNDGRAGALGVEPSARRYLEEM